MLGIKREGKQRCLLEEHLNIRKEEKGLCTNAADNEKTCDDQLRERRIQLTSIGKQALLAASLFKTCHGPSNQ